MFYVQHDLTGEILAWSAYYDAVRGSIRVAHTSIGYIPCFNEKY